MGNWRVITLAVVLVCSYSVNTQQQTLTRCRQQLDLIIAIDGSNSMGRPNFDLQINSISNMVGNLDVSPNNVHVGALLYSLEVVPPVIPLSPDKAQVVNGMRAWAYPDQETRTDLAIDEAMDMFSMDGRGGPVPQILIIVTDGASTNQALTQEAARKAKQMGIQIFAVGVSGARNEIDLAELRAIASDPSQVLVTPDFSTLERDLKAATEKICVPLECGQANIDMVFMLDSSSTVGPENFEKLKEFIVDFLYFAHIHVGKIRVGVMTFSDRPVMQFSMLSYVGNEDAMNQAIRSIQYRPGRTNIAAAFQMVRQEMYAFANGDRPEAPDVAFFVSGSMASLNQGQTRVEAEATRAAGIQVYSIGFGLPSTRDLDLAASRPLEQNRFTVPDCDHLRTIIEPVYKNFNRFCSDPPPVPACSMGQTDVWYVVDVSMNVAQLSQGTVMGDFGQLKNGLTEQINIVMDPSVANPGVRMGLVSFSDQPQINVSPPDQASVMRTVQAVNNLPGFVRVGGSNIVPALQLITARPQQSRWNSYVALVTPQSAYDVNYNQVQAELQRLQQLGYTIVLFTVRDNSRTPPQQLQSSASGPQYFYYINDYTALEAATKNFTRDVLCAPPPPAAPVPPPAAIAAGLCARTRYQLDGMDVTAHPAECDKYVQCYFNQAKKMDIAIVRTCPPGLHWAQNSRSCMEPAQANCQSDKCLEDCKPYKMEGGSCGAYWECEGKRSQPKCCRPMFSFKEGKGCVFDPACQSECVPGKWCGICMKKANFAKQYGYDVLTTTPVAGNPRFPNNPAPVSRWTPRHCDYNYFDLVTCDCTKEMSPACPADRSFNFRNNAVVQQVMSGRAGGVRVKDVRSTQSGLTLSTPSELHVDMKEREKGAPFSVTLRFSEGKTFSPYGEVLLTSGLNCGNKRGLVVSADDRFIRAQAKSEAGGKVTVSVPYQGIAASEFKTLGITYSKGVLTLIVMGRNHQYISESKTPVDICLSCGIDIGGSLNKQSFTGQVESIAVYSCAIQST